LTVPQVVAPLSLDVAAVANRRQEKASPGSV
jgi:hypothetical protein